MKVYLLEARKRINQHANETLWDIGLFKNPEAAIKYIKENKDIMSEVGFYALLECDLSWCSDLWFHSAYDKNGERTYLYSKNEIADTK